MKKISVNESINKKRLIYPIDFEVIFSYLMMYFLSLILPVCTVMVFISDKQHNREPLISFYIIAILIDLWMIAGIYYTNKLVHFSDETLIDRQKDIISILKDYYPDTEFYANNSNLIRGEKEIGWLKMRARIITVILDGDNIYVNILNTYRGENFSPIQGVYNYFRSKKLTRYIYNNLSFN